VLRSRAITSLGGILAAFAFAATLSVAASEAEGIPVRFHGRVQWVAGETMVVVLDDSPSISIDLSHVAQDEYAGLAQGDWVVVTGTVPDERDRVIATSVLRLAP
jgi:hypothetical protein